MWKSIINTKFKRTLRHNVRKKSRKITNYQLEKWNIRFSYFKRYIASLRPSKCKFRLKRIIICGCCRWSKWLYKSICFGISRSWCFSSRYCKWAFKIMHRNSLIIKKKIPLNWCSSRKYSNWRWSKKIDWSRCWWIKMRNRKWKYLYYKNCCWGRSSIIRSTI